jgi:hypothetical protein
MSFYENYKKLRWAIFGKDILVLDHNPYGCTTQLLNLKVIVIVVHPGLSFKNMTFTLAHELGHHFKIMNKKWVPASNFSEKEANTNAISILKHVLNKNLSKEYFLFYHNIKTKVNSKKLLKVHSCRYNPTTTPYKDSIKKRR